MTVQQQKRMVEQAASNRLAVLEHAIVIEARVLVARMRAGAEPDLRRLAALVDDRELAQQAHIAAMRAYQETSVTLTKEPFTDLWDA